MFATGVRLFGTTPIVESGRVPYGMKNSQTRKRNQKLTLKHKQNVEHILSKYDPPKRNSGIPIPKFSFYQDSIPAEIKS